VNRVDADLDQLLEHMAGDLKRLFQLRRGADTVMIGIHTGGVWVAQRLHRLLHLEVALSTLDISFYRDDFTRAGINPQVKPSRLPMSIDDRHIILVDDVLYTGRTVRAALNEIFDYGRPATVALAALVDRGGRELPIQADVVGLHMEVAPGRQVKLQGPEPLRLIVSDVPPAAA
jgi:pyrimidine operon attenuation protein / uracil phosphoribosyltransferase